MPLADSEAAVLVVAVADSLLPSSELEVAIRAAVMLMFKV